VDTRPINASLNVSAFNPTGNPGEYTFDSAVYNNQADQTGNGAYDVQVGFVLYVPSTDFNTGIQLPGVLHRYRLTEVNVIDPATLSGTMVWDETGEEGLQIPTNGVGCGLSQASQNYGFGYAPNDTIYPDLVPGSTAQSVQTDLWNKVDPREGNGGGPSSSFKTTVGDGSTLSFDIHHALSDMDVTITVYELATGADVYAETIRTGPDDIQINFSYPIEADSHRVIVRA